MEIFMGYIVLSIFILIVDIMTKLVAELNLRSVDTIPLWNNVFHLTYVENRGIAFGMFSDARLVFIVISILVLAALAVLYSKIGFRTRWLKVGTALIYGGAHRQSDGTSGQGLCCGFSGFQADSFSGVQCG